MQVIMEQDEITRRNVAIAEYMGCPPVRLGEGFVIHMEVFAEILWRTRYDRNFTILMQVVEKITKESFLSFHFYPPMGHETFTCRFGMGKNHVGSTMIEATWIAVSEYVLSLKP